VSQGSRENPPAIGSFLKPRVLTRGSLLGCLYRSPNETLAPAYYFPASPLSIIKCKNNRLFIHDTSPVIGHQ
jgi:hypothetical protein